MNLGFRLFLNWKRSIVEFIKSAIDLFLHLDVHLTDITALYGTTTYIILCCVIFAETGFVFTPFLPGDSLLFAAGSVAALGTINIHLLVIMLIVSAVLGDTVNYWAGKKIGMKLFERNSRFLKKEYLDKTHKFYETHGGRTIIFARFVPIVRTFAPFVAGLGAMTYRKFIIYCVTAAVIWVGLLAYAGYFFGAQPIIKKNFSIVILVIIFISILPAIIEFIKHKRAKGV